MSDPPPAEKTFKSFTKEQSANYAQNRRGYHANLYKTIIDHHNSTGGKLNLLLDAGCGPGTAARELAPLFKHVIGIDPSEGMIANARSLGGETSTSELIRFEIASAEDLGSQLSPPVVDGSVDLITGSTAAHWFDMTRFWPEAARVLKPGGSVAIWLNGGSTMHPSTPNGPAIQAAIDEIDEKELNKYMEPGNLLAKNLYVDLKLPWTVEPPVLGFDKATFFRKVWGLENSEDEFFSGGAIIVDLDTMEKMWSTASLVQRWRDAHPDVAGTGRDILKILRFKIEQLLHEAGVEKGKEILQSRSSGALLIVKKTA
jgi:SAM-dependent methyltransferase